MGHSLLNGLEAVHGKQECCIEKEKPPRHCALAALTRQLAKSTRHENNEVTHADRTITWMQKKSSLNVYS